MVSHHEGLALRKAQHTFMLIFLFLFILLECQSNCTQCLKGRTDLYSMALDNISRNIVNHIDQLRWEGVLRLTAHIL